MTIHELVIALEQIEERAGEGVDVKEVKPETKDGKHIVKAVTKSGKEIIEEMEVETL